jgi:hypothetical protein
MLFVPVALCASVVGARDICLAREILGRREEDRFGDQGIEIGVDTDAGQIIDTESPRVSDLDQNSGFAGPYA